MTVSVLVPTTGPWSEVAGYAALADELGYESVNCSHISARDSFTTLAALAVSAPHVRLGTAVAPLYHRSPASMAQTGATVDDLSGGRFRLGLGTGHRITMGQWHGAEIGKPLAEMREYVGVVRTLWSGQTATDGQRWRSEFGFVGFTPRPDIPIYLAALSRSMIRLAAEIADGIVLWACPSSYVRDVVVPEIAEVRRAAGLDIDGFDILAAVPAAATDDVDTAMTGVRDELHRYFGLPFYRAMFQAAGYDDDIAAYDAAEDRAAQLNAISERFILDLCAIGDNQTVAQVLQRYRQAGASNPMITQIRGTDFLPTLHAAAEQ
ncbi:alkanesulfonate monooxygenase SsuD/methylene tetrahydromethanopterin reductase-like flavin-dependent oxidoreductase (luciferase family) [Mycobacterium sp. MAA66]|uniref:LLM class flavin-dependent oxidoreductase n=1 Tax=Mycobacterium sp. MAA66 TaxID=3156297 RepID=UPI0035110B83